MCIFRIAHDPSTTTGMQKKKALELRQAWGDKPCPHPAFAREYDLGKRTGGYICTQCGASISFREKAEITASRKD